MQRVQRLVLYALVYVGAAVPCEAASLNADAINKATFETGGKGGSAVLIKAEVLLDRAGFSPGVIDGRDGENLKKAVRAFQRGNGLSDTGHAKRQVPLSAIRKYSTSLLGRKLC
jgi:peptidoglycan hydrolase-like protein with peptidoglycan-binding domain